MLTQHLTVTSIEQRRHLIAMKCESPERHQRFYEHLPEGIDLPVIVLDQSLPVYRMENYRTRTRQITYLHQHNLPSKFFSQGQEDVESQRAQHEILLEIAKRGQGETIVPIFDALRRDGRQTEPLLITREGVVVNGNRRLAAMRELYFENADMFRDFQSVQAMILPESITADDVRRIEIRLQMQRETKLPYDWTDEALAVREMQEREFPTQQILELMRLNKESEITSLVERLNEAEIYLSDYLGTPEEYEHVVEQVQQFTELQKSLQSKNSAQEKELARSFCHVLTENSRDLGGRAYNYRIAYGNATVDVAERLADRLNIDLDNNSLAENDDDGDIFSSDSDTTDPAEQFEPLKSVLASGDQSRDIAQAIADICDEIKEEDKESKRGQKALQDAKRILRITNTIDLDSADSSTYPELRDTLSQAIESLKDLSNKLSTQ